MVALKTFYFVTALLAMCCLMWILVIFYKKAIITQSGKFMRVVGLPLLSMWPTATIMSGLFIYSGINKMPGELVTFLYLSITASMVALYLRPARWLCLVVLLVVFAMI